jgi:hypothetical protein
MTGIKDKELRPVLIGAAFVIACALCAGALCIVLNDKPLGADEPVTQAGKEAASPDKPTTIPATETLTAGLPEAQQNDTADVRLADSKADAESLDASVVDVGGSGGGAGSAGSAAGNTGQQKSKIWHEGWNEWVVDVPGHNEQQLVSAAWDEQTGHYAAVCNICLSELVGTYLDHAKATGHNAGYTAPYWVVTGSIHHDEIYQDVWIAEAGHNVWHEGYWE